ncbi:MAG TPA: SGNH/GDSL hydrolase family protein [Bradyrhizobium sp.]|nr:SGNH/GDSL hydrolase family protein [Bradyrhizobium sp.]
MKRVRVRHILSSIAQPLLIVVVTLAVLEVALRIANFTELRDTVTEHSPGYDYDAELGWAPVPNSSSEMTTFRTTHFKHNSLGLRDQEFTPDGKPTIMFLGDSFVWGLDSEADERFSELLKPRLPGYKILAAGVAGYGTDQEYLLLQRLWPKIKPAVVVLVFCAENDRLDNVTNIRYGNYHKPYFATPPDGSLELMGEPVPRSHLLYYRDDWLVRNLWLARLVTDGYLRLRYPPVFVPDPTEKLVGKIREFVEGNGAKFMVAIQYQDAALASYLEAKAIPFAKLEGAPHYNAGWGPHWTPEGHQFVADRIFQMLAANHIASETPAAR